jgi:hypothetical protein
VFRFFCVSISSLCLVFLCSPFLFNLFDFSLCVQFVYWMSLVLPLCVFSYSYVGF